MQRLRDMVAVAYDRSEIDKLLGEYSDTGTDRLDSVSDLVCCPRAYEDEFLREPVGSERACTRGEDCEGLQVEGGDGFVLREFLYPHTPPPDGSTLCLLCRRFEISRAYYEYETGNKQPSQRLRISDHYNLVGVAGEYDVRDCIVSGGSYTGLPLPVVLHVRSAYTPYTKDGVKHLSQSRMRSPGDQKDTTGPFLMRRATLERQVARSAHPDSA